MAATIILLIAVVYLLLPNSYPRFISPNELSRTLLTKAIVEERSVTLDRGVASQENLGSHLLTSAILRTRAPCPP